MIGQNAFESFLQTQLRGAEHRTFVVDQLELQGWDVETLLDLVADYAEVPPTRRRFAVTVERGAPIATLTIERLAEGLPRGARAVA